MLFQILLIDVHSRPKVSDLCFGCIEFRKTFSELAMCISGIFDKNPRIFNQHNPFLSHVSQKPEFYGTTCIFFLSHFFSQPTEQTAFAVPRYWGYLGTRIPMIYRETSQESRKTSQLEQVVATIHSIQMKNGEFMVYYCFTIVDPIPSYFANPSIPVNTIHHHSPSSSIMKHYETPCTNPNDYPSNQSKLIHHP